jgi:hypothetical protein
VIKISFGCVRDFCVKMWGTSSPEDKLAGNVANVIGAISTGGRRLGFFYSKKLAPSNLGLLQQYLPQPDSCSAAKIPHSITSLARTSSIGGTLRPSALAVALLSFARGLTVFDRINRV